MGTQTKHRQPLTPGERGHPIWVNVDSHLEARLIKTAMWGSKVSTQLNFWVDVWVLKLNLSWFSWSNEDKWRARTHWPSLTHNECQPSLGWLYTNIQVVDVMYGTRGKVQSNQTRTREKWAHKKRCGGSTVNVIMPQNLRVTWCLLINNIPVKTRGTVSPFKPRVVSSGLETQRLRIFRIT